MKYMGSKNRVAKDILPIMLKNREDGQYWVEPFVGGANMIDKVLGNRIGSDINEYLIALLIEMQKSSFKAPYINEKLYLDIKENIANYEKWLVGFTAFQLSYGAMWFSAYRKDNFGKRDYAKEAINNIEKQSKNLSNIKFLNKNYFELVIPKNSIIYCDPPYKNTASYKGVETFNHETFWKWCEQKHNEGHTVFVSEYIAPAHWQCIWEKELVSSLAKDTGSKKAIERLFTLC